MAKIATNEPKVATKVATIPSDCAKFTYSLRKYNVERNETTTTDCIVAFDAVNLYLVEQASWKPITMRLPLALLKGIVKEVQSADDSNKVNFYPDDSVESAPILADYWNSGLDFNGKSNGKASGWIEPTRQAYRFEWQPNGLAFRVDAPQGKNKVVRSIAISQPVMAKLVNLIGKAELVESAPIADAVTVSDAELAELAKLAD